MVNKLPNHVPVKIDPKDIGIFKEELIKLGYNWIFLQVVKPRQIVGRVKSLLRNDIPSEHHVRVFTDGTITTEYEIPRVEQMWLHLTTVSYSAHEKIIEILTYLNINYNIDQVLRERYNVEAIDNYPRDYMEFFNWLFIGVLYYTPLGYIWKFFYHLRNKMRIFILNYRINKKDGIGN